MSILDVFDGLTVKKMLERTFSECNVEKVVASNSGRNVTIFLSADHPVSAEDIREMEKELQDQYFSAVGNKVHIKMDYKLSSSYNPVTLWNNNRRDILDEIKSTSKINAIFLDTAEIDVLENNGYVMTIKAPFNYINKRTSEEITKLFKTVFCERFGFDISIVYDWYETNEERKEDNEVFIDTGVSVYHTSSENRKRSREKKKQEKEGSTEAVLNDLTGKENEIKETVENAAVSAKPTEEKPAEVNDKKPEEKEAQPDKNREETKDGEKKQNTWKYDKNRFYAKKPPEDPDIFYGKPFETEDDKPIPIIEVQEGYKDVICYGKILKLEDPIKMKKRDAYIVKFAFTDFTDTICAKLFIDEADFKEVTDKLKPGKCIRLKGLPKYDTYDKELEFSSIIGIKSIKDFTAKREDKYDLKRVELHAHTMMSDMDACVDPKVLCETAFNWGHPAVAITDHGVVQAFPDAFHWLRDKQKDKNPEVAEKAKAFKILYGCEIYLVDDVQGIVKRDMGQKLDHETVVFDIETTGFSKQSDKIIEFGAVKLVNNEIVDRFSCFVNPEMPIPSRIVELTHITDDMVSGAETIDVVMPKFLEFCGDSVIVAHNASFDTGFVGQYCENHGISYAPTIVDTVALSKSLLTDIKNYKLDTVADELKIRLDNHHRAVDDAECTALIYIKLCEILKKQGMDNLSEVASKLRPSVDSVRKQHPYHCILLCKNETGRVNLYKMISLSHLKYFQRTPKIPKSVLMEHREGLIVGSACCEGELFKAVLEEDSTERINSLCDFYDYYEIQPVGNNNYLIDDENYPFITSVKDLEGINKKIVELGERFNKPVCATCDVHFLNPEDEVYRRLLMSSKKFKDADNQPPLFFRTTEEMLLEFNYLGLKKAKEVVIDNTNLICNMIEKIEPVRPDKCPPVIENSEETLRKICHDKAHSMYGDKLPAIVETRLEKELNSIIENGYSVMYIIAQKLVWKSNEDGYLVGSRGSVGSSFVATMAGITEVNPLPAHYYCKNCRYSDFDSDEVKKYQKESICGFDMPDKVCPVCGKPLTKDGADIPFETFLGFNCDKEPDIDLNFSGEYQSKAHDYTEVIFGKGQTFKAGTVGTVADKTALGYAIKYDEEHGLTHRREELERLSSGCVGVRRTTGQHPGGIIVLPVGEDIDTFTPVQHPANDMTSNVITTHFDYHSIDHNLLKLDILGHDDPTMIKRLEELTGIDAKTIPMDDKKVISLFHGTEALGISAADLGGIDMGSLGLPELGTDNAMNMLRETKPDCFSDMVRISGLSHGTDVYANNAQDLIKSGTCNLKQAICTRDDIMLYLINKGLEPGHAFKIMESVRKGKGLTEDWEKEMREHDVPDWYIGSCKKIKYMFPKAHACAYIMMAFRVAWFKVYKPLHYYAAYFGIRASAFDYELMCLGKERLIKNMNQIKAKKDNRENFTDKDETTYMNMKSVLEMYARGYEFMPIDIFRAKAHAFQVIDGKVMPSFDSIAGLGEKASDLMYEGCKGGPFTSRQNFKERTKAPQSAIDTMAKLGLLGDIPESDQLSFSDLFAGF